MAYIRDYLSKFHPATQEQTTQKAQTVTPTQTAKQARNTASFDKLNPFKSEVLNKRYKQAAIKLYDANVSDPFTDAYEATKLYGEAAIGAQDAGSPNALKIGENFYNNYLNKRIMENSLAGKSYDELIGMAVEKGYNTPDSDQGRINAWASVLEQQLADNSDYNGDYLSEYVNVYRNADKYFNSYNLRGLSEMTLPEQHAWNKLFADTKGMEAEDEATLYKQYGAEQLNYLQQAADYINNGGWDAYKQQQEDDKRNAEIADIWKKRPHEINEMLDFYENINQYAMRMDEEGEGILTDAQKRAWDQLKAYDKEKRDQGIKVWNGRADSYFLGKLGEQFAERIRQAENYQGNEYDAILDYAKRNTIEGAKAWVEAEPDNEDAKDNLYFLEWKEKEDSYQVDENLPEYTAEQKYSMNKLANTLARNKLDANTALGYINKLPDYVAAGKNYEWAIPQELKPFWDKAKEHFGGDIYSATPEELAAYTQQMASEVQALGAGLMAGQYDHNVQDDFYKFINNVGDVQGALAISNSGDLAAQTENYNRLSSIYSPKTLRAENLDEMSVYSLMDDAQVAKYNAIYAAEGPDAAREYIDKYLIYGLHDQQADAVEQSAYETASSGIGGAVSESAVGVASAPFRGLGYFDVLAQKAQNWLSGEYRPTDYNRAANQIGKRVDAGRQGVMDSVDWNVNIFGEEWDAFDFLYGTAMSGLDSAVASLTGPAMGAFIMGSGAAQSTMQDIHDRGGNDGQALIGGAVSGVFEYLFEEWSLGKLFKDAKKISKASFKDALKTVGKEMGVNFSEEFFTEVANVAYDTIFNGDISKATLEMEYYQKMGLSPEEARARVAQNIGLQLLEAGASGMVMGAGFGAVGATTSAINTNKASNKAGTDIISMGNQEKLQQIAMGFDEGSEAAKLAKDYNPETATPKQTGDLYRAVVNELPAQMKETITETFANDAMNKLEEMGEMANVPETAIAVMKVVSGQELTQQEYMAVANSEHGLELIHDLTGANEQAQAKQETPEQAKPMEQEAETEEAPVAPAEAEQQDIQVNDDGEVTVPTESGERVALDEAGLGDAETIITQEMAKAGDEGVKAAMEAWNAEANAQDATLSDAREFATGFKSAYEAEMEGGASSSIAAGQISQEAREAAIKAARANRAKMQEKIAKSNAQRAKADGFKTSQEAGEETGVSYAQVTKKVSEMAKRQLQALDEYGKENGIRFQIFDTLNGGKANGKFQKGSNLISLALDAEGGLITRTASHETFHFIENWNAEAAQKLQNFVVETLKGKEGYNLENEIKARIEQYRLNGQELSRPEAIREIVADSMLDVIGTEANIQKLLKQDQSLTAKISEVLKNITAKLKAAMQKLGWSSAEIQALQGDMDYYESIQQMMDEALKGAKENYAAAQYKASELARQDSAVAEYITDMKSATSQADAQAALNGMVSNLFMRAEKGWIANNPNVDLDESLQKFAGALKSYKRGEMALENALKKAGFDAQPYEMNTALSYAGTQLLQAEAKGQGGDVQYSLKTSAYDFTKPFADQVDDFDSNTFPLRDTPLLGRTPELLRQIGISDLPMILDQTHLDYMLNGTHPTEPLDHKYDKAAIKKLPELIADPIAVIESKTKSTDSVVVIVNMKSANGKDSIAALAINGVGKVNGKAVDGNVVTTVHGRKNTLGLLTAAINSPNAVYYINKTEAHNLYTRSGVQFPGVAIQDGLIRSIHDAGVSVNKKYMDQTDSRQFKHWFGKSKVKNPDGTPKIVYHGSKARNIDVFKTSNQWGYGGMYLTDRKEIAEGFTKGWGSNEPGRVYELYARIEKPLIIDAMGKRYDEIAVPKNFPKDQLFGGKTVDTQQLANWARELGRDGLIVENVVEYDLIGTDYIVFSPNQVKSATDNVGTFSRENDDHQFSFKNTQAEKTLNQHGIELLNSGTATMQHSFKTYTKNERARMLDALVAAGFERESAEKWLKALDSVSAKIGAARERLDFEAADNHTMLKKNQEYRYTVDASTLCKKRLLYQGTFNAIQHRLPNRMISSDELLELLTMMRDTGYETPCGICYVESMRRHLGRYAQRWLDDYHGEYIPSLDEVTTSDGLENLRHEHPKTYDDFTKAMKKLGTANPKLVQLRTEYNGEIRTRSQRVIDYLNKHGGLRVQSYSDFEVYNALDMMQVFVDMAARGLKSQAYTKVPEYARIFGKTGQKINLSLIAEGSGLDENGNLIFSSTEGMDFKTALEIRKNNSANVGTIIVGTSKEHILKCMADDRIDFIIPFHRSGWGQHEMEMMGIGMYEDFTKWQNEKHLVNGRNVKKSYDPSEYWDFSKTGKENAEAYLKKCAAEGRIPKFSNFLVDNGDGSYSLQPDGSTDGYWKTLIDFKMYDNSGKGSPQVAVQPNFNMREVNRILKEATGTASSLPVAQDVVERFVKKLEGEEQFSLKKTDLAKSVEDDSTLFTQVKSDEDISTAMGIWTRLYYTMRRGDSYTQEGANVPPQAEGDWMNRYDRVADKLIEETGSKISKIKLKRKLKALYTAMDAGNTTPGEMMVYARGIAMAVLEEAPGVVNEMDESTKDVLQALKNIPFYLTDDMKSEIRATQGSLADYMRKNFGRMKIRANGTKNMSSLAELWEETLHPLRPDVFTMDATEADMPIILDAFLETANEKTYNSFFEGNFDQYATDIGLSVILEYYDLPGLANKAQVLRDELKATQQQIRSEYKQKYAERIQNNRERKQTTEAKQAMRKKISRMVRSMNSRLLTNSDNKHIPEELKGAVSAMVRPFLDETGVFTKPELNAILHQYSMLAEGGKNQDIEAAYAYDEEIRDKIDKVAQTMAGRRLSQLTLEELTDLRDIVGNLNKIIFEQNEMQVNGRKILREELGTRAINEQKKKSTLSARAEKLMNTLYINTTPIYFFKRLGGVFTELWDDVRNGQTKYIFNVRKAKNYITEQIEKYNVNQWYNEKQPLKFRTQEGDDIELTKGQAMYLYATWQREMKNKMQDAAHLRIGGFVYAKTAENGKLKIDTAHPHSLTQADMDKITAYIGKQAMEFVDETVRYLSEDMAALGNETSMERYGYEKFGESYYFPYKVSSDYTETNLAKEKTETPSSLFAWGASKKTTSKADKPVVLGDYMDTWANHVNEMCVFNGFATAVDNLNRVYNFVTPSIVKRDADGNIISKQKTESLRAEVARANGSGAAKYIADITKAIAGGQIGRSEDMAFLQKMVSKFRKNAVVLSASVAVQQPSSIARAMAHINPKFFVGAPKNPRNSYKELLKYSGTANVKEMGKFDVGMGQSAKQWMLDELSSGSKLKDAAGKADELMGKAPEMMDQLTWAALWETVKREQQAKNPMMDPVSEEFLKLCGKRFDEVVDLTQVYDSVLSRSKLMRSNDGLAQMVTSFMAEPTLTTNMLMDAIINFKENKSTRNHVTVKRAAAVYMTNVFLNALLQSLVTAARDDDEEKTYVEKYLAEFTENFTDDLTPLGNIPIVKDVISIFDGYDVERADMALVSDLADAWKIVKDENKSVQDKLLASGKAVGALFGIPVKNAIREVQTVINLANNKPISETSKVNIKYGVLEALPFTDLDGKVTPYYNRMLAAMKKGDMEQYDELKGYVTGTMGTEEKSMLSGMKKLLKDEVLAGKITSDEAQKYLKEYWGMDADDAYFTVDEWLEAEENKDNAEFKYSRYGDVYEAVKAGKSISEPSKELIAQGYTEKDIKSEIKSKIGEWYKNGEMDKAAAEKALAQYTDDDADTIYWQMRRWTYVKENGSDKGYSVYNDFYKAVETGVDLKKAIQEMTSHGYENSTLAGQITKNYKDQYISLMKTNKTAAANLKARLLTAYAALGYDRTKKAKEIDAWLTQK